jgi:hypothetical protein
MWIKVVSIAICTGEMPDQQRERRCLALWPGKNFIGGTLSPGMSMARSLPNVFTIAAECAYN